MIFPSLRSAATAAAAALLLSSSASAAVTTTQRQQSSDSTTIACNNSPELCDKTYDSITHMGAHDSAFVRDESTGDSIAGNQFFNSTIALDAGLRLIQAQVHEQDGVARLCHTACELMDAGPLETWLESIAEWMSQNPNEVVTLLLVNSDEFPVTTFGRALASSGLEKYGYSRTSNSSSTSWPTLREMINQNTRLVTFVASIDESPQYPNILTEFNYVFETPFEVTDISLFNCTADRPSGLSSGSSAHNQQGFLGLVNHFAYTTVVGSIMYPNVDAISTTNSPSTTVASSLGKHAQECQQEWGFQPNFMLVDFFNRGPAIKTADNLNGISAASVTGRMTNAQMEALGTQGGAAPGSLRLGGAMGSRWTTTGALVVSVVGALVLF